MVDIKSLNLTEAIISKLSEKSVTDISDLDNKFYTAIEEGSNVNAKGSFTEMPIILSLVKKLEAKKLKSNRSPRAIVIAENSEACQKFLDELKSLISKEIVSVLCHSQTGMKKNKKKLTTATDVIIGDVVRINELIKSDSFKVKSIYTLIILGADKVLAADSIKNISEIISKLPEKNLDASSNDSDTKLQLVLSCTEDNENVTSFISKHIKSCVILGENSESEDSSDESEEDSSDDVVEEKETIVKEINGNAASSDEASSEEEASSDDEEDKKSEDKKPEEKMEVEETKSKIGSEIATKIKNVSEFAEYEPTAKKLIEEDGDVKSLARAMALIAQKNSNGVKPVKKTTQVLHTGPGSKLTGRAGYTAYIFRTNIEAFSKGYLFKGLKRNIEEELVEKIERVQQSLDKMQFVFDLPSEHDEAFQGSWSDGKFDSMELLEGELPELLPMDHKPTFDGSRGGRGGGDRGGSRGRGGFERGGRGGFERGGRGGSRGGFESRGRGGDRGGKRPFNGGPATNAKVQKFE